MYKKIRLLMLTHKVTFEELAQKLKVSRNTASDKVNGKTKMSVEDLKVIQKEFFSNYTLDELAN